MAIVVWPKMELRGSPRAGPRPKLTLPQRHAPDMAEAGLVHLGLGRYKNASVNSYEPAVERNVVRILKQEERSG